jgi:hypothetical protein
LNPPKTQAYLSFVAGNKCISVFVVHISSLFSAKTLLAEEVVNMIHAETSKANLIEKIGTST